jgi:hypothetical protein
MDALPFGGSEFDLVLNRHSAFHEALSSVMSNAV